MIKWFKRNQQKPSPVEEQNILESESASSPIVESAEIPAKPLSLYDRFKRSMSKTRHKLGLGLERLLHGKKSIDAAIFEEVETLLLSADLGMTTTISVLKDLEQALARNELVDGDSFLQKLKSHLQQLLEKNSQVLNPETKDKRPFVILTVGVNGAGKTTTIGKLAKLYQNEGKKVMLAAGDTFRAAAIEQLQVWGERNNIPVIAQKTGADSASVLYDALQAAAARQIDILIADTAGRLHTQNNLMEELKKAKRVLQKLDPQAPHEVMLILDASIGQNALNQAREFHQAIGLTGITMTKLDGTAKGGILFAIANELGIPFRYIGLGEGIDDLRLFSAQPFVKALFNDD